MEAAQAFANLHYDTTYILDQKDPSMLFMKRSVRGWGTAREDPRFQEIFDEIGLDALSLS